jgi:hypothetical protein
MQTGKPAGMDFASALVLGCTLVRIWQWPVFRVVALNCARNLGKATTFAEIRA